MKINEGKLILAPTVTPVAFNTFTASGLQEWVESQGLQEEANNPETPLGKLVEAVDQSDLIPEFGGRFCYRAWKRGRGHEDYIENILSSGHGSVLEHGYMTLAISGVSRTLTHELIRHRAGFAVSQESQRYVDAKDINFVVPPMMLEKFGPNSSEVADWFMHCQGCVDQYIAWQEIITDTLKSDHPTLSKTLLKKRANEAARSVLPNAVETRLVWSGNYRAFRHLLSIRGDTPADLEIKRLQHHILDAVRTIAPMNFADFNVLPTSEEDFGIPAIKAQFAKV